MSDNQFPDGFIDAISDSAEFNAPEFIQAHAMDAPVSVRLHPVKNTFEFPIKNNVPWCADGFYLFERPVFTLDPLLHAGCYYVQEASSMFTAHALQTCCDLHQPHNILDLCAAPGGKSTHIASIISEDSILVSNEFIKQRVQILRENMVKWGSTNTVITHNAAKQFGTLPQFFDVIIADVPCSGSGLFRKDKEAMHHWSKQNVIMCNQRQQSILHDVLPALKENGILIYSTCSYSAEENENIIDHLITDYQMECMDVPVNDAWHIVRSVTGKGGIGYRFYPDKLQGEGFFISVLRNTKTQQSAEAFTQKEIILTQPTANDKLKIAQWIADADNLEIFGIHKKLIGVSAGLLPKVQMLANRLIVLQSGIELGEIKGKDVIPAHALALSGILHPDIVRFNLDKTTALQYLRKQEIQIPGNYTGWSVVCYKNIPLGWIKKLNNRINNYYPAEYRIRM